MSHITYNTVNVFAALNINTMTENERSKFMFDFATKYNTSAHDIFQFMKAERDAYLASPIRDQMILENAISFMTVKVALFNARQCYRTMLDIVA